MAVKKKIAFFEKYLSLWVALCIAGGILIGFVAGDAMQFMSTWEIYQVNIPIAILIWMMIYPMMLQIDWSQIRVQTLQFHCRTLVVRKNLYIRVYEYKYKKRFTYC